MEDEKLLTSAEAREILGLSEVTMSRLRRHKTGPRFARFGVRCVRYRKSDVLQWLEGQCVENAATACAA